MTAYNPIIGAPPAIQWVAIDQLAVDPAYQRSVENAASKRLIERIAKGWDWRLCTPLLVSRRERGLFVLDGQHRMQGALVRGDIPHLPASVVTFDSVADEAMIFVAANRARKTMNKLDLYRAAVVAEEPEALIIDQLVREAGLSMALHTHPNRWEQGQLGFTAGLFSALRTHGRGIVSAALTVMGDAFGRQVMPQGGVIFAGLVLTFVRAKPDFDPDRLLEVMKQWSADEWGEHPSVIDLRGGQNRAEAMRRAIAEQYSAPPRYRGSNEPLRRADRRHRRATCHRAGSHRSQRRALADGAARRVVEQAP